MNVLFLAILFASLVAVIYAVPAKNTNILTIKEDQSIAGSDKKGGQNNNTKSSDNEKAQSQQLQKVKTRTKQNTEIDLKQGQQGQSQGNMKSKGQASGSRSGLVAQSQQANSIETDEDIGHKKPSTTTAAS